MIKEPEYYLKKFTSFFKINNSYSITRAVFICSFVVSMLSFYLYIINGQGCPDSLTEGLYYYHNGNWHLQCGRWALRYINFFSSSNVVMPLFGVLTLWISVSISTIQIAKLWNIKNTLTSAVIAMVMTSTPATIDWSVYNSVFLAYSLCILLSSTFVYLMFKKENEILNIIIGSILVSVIFGTYQSFIGYILGLYVLTTIVMLLNNERELLRPLIKSVISGIVGVVIYFIILKVSLKVFNLSGSERLDKFNIKDIFTNIKETSIDTYKSYISYFFKDYSLKKKYINLLVFVITFVLLIDNAFVLVKNHRLKDLVIILFLIISLPLTSNIIRLITPFNPISSLMNYQNVLLYPFALTLCLITKNNNDSFKNLLNISVLLLTLYIVWAYIITANATFTIYKQTYSLIEHKTSSMLNNVYNLEEYKVDDTIVFVGFIDDSVIQNSTLAKYARYQNNSNVVYWKDYFGMTTGAHFYLFNEFGLDNAIVDIDKYNSFIESEEFKKMNIWPANNSIKKVDNLVFIKLTNNPPYGY